MTAYVCRCGLTRQMFWHACIGCEQLSTYERWLISQNEEAYDKTETTEGARRDCRRSAPVSAEAEIEAIQTAEEEAAETRKGEVG